MNVEGLDRPCGACSRIAGDHTMREWAECMGTTTFDLPYEAVPDDTAKAAAAAVRKQFELDADLIVADHVNVKAVTLAGATGELSIAVPCVLHEFQIGVAHQPPVTVAKVLFLGTTDTVRGYGRLVRDNANGAANAVKRGSS